MRASLLSYSLCLAWVGFSRMVVAQETSSVSVESSSKKEPAVNLSFSAGMAKASPGKTSESGQGEAAPKESPDTKNPAASEPVFVTELPIADGSLQRTAWVMGAHVASGVALSPRDESYVGQPVFLAHLFAGYDFTRNQCLSAEKKDSRFCVEGLVQIEVGGGYLTQSRVPLFRWMLGFEFDLYFGTQRTVALSLKWRMGYGYYGLWQGDASSDIDPSFQLAPSDGPHRLEFGLGPGLLVHLGALVPSARGISLFIDTHMVSPYTFGFVGALGVQYRF